MLGDPEAHILADGGRILFAIDDSLRALGTVALLRHDDDLVELTKMAVAPRFAAGHRPELVTGALEAFESDGTRPSCSSNRTRVSSRP